MNLLGFVFETFWVGPRFVPSPFLVSNFWLLILNNGLRNGSVSACSTVRSNVAEVNEISNNGTVP